MRGFTFEGEGMTKDIRYQLPLRLPEKLADALNKASDATGVGKSTLCRMGLSRILKDLENTGRVHSMKQFTDHYEEIS